MKKVNRFLRCFTQIGATGALLYGSGSCNIDNFWVDGGVTARDALISDFVGAVFATALGLFGL